MTKKQQQALSELLDEGLVKGRLLVAGKDEQGKAWIDLAHEALIEGCRGLPNGDNKTEICGDYVIN
jgi:hypothetical protein